MFIFVLKQKKTQQTIKNNIIMNKFTKISEVKNLSYLLLNEDTCDLKVNEIYSFNKEDDITFYSSPNQAFLVKETEDSETNKIIVCVSMINESSFKVNFLIKKPTDFIKLIDIIKNTLIPVELTESKKYEELDKDNTLYCLKDKEVSTDNIVINAEAAIYVKNILTRGKNIKINQSFNTLSIDSNNNIIMDKVYMFSSIIIGENSNKIIDKYRSSDNVICLESRNYIESGYGSFIKCEDKNTIDVLIGNTIECCDENYIKCGDRCIIIGKANNTILNAVKSKINLTCKCNIIEARDCDIDVTNNCYINVVDGTVKCGENCILMVRGEVKFYIGNGTTVCNHDYDTGEMTYYNDLKPNIWYNFSRKNGQKVIEKF